MVNRAWLIILLLMGGTVFPFAAQPPVAGKDLFTEIRKRAEHGDPEAELALGNLYASGKGVSKSLSNAIKWHRKAADHGLARAQYQLGLDYAGGLGVKEDKAAALEWFLKAAEQGMVEAQFGVGLAFLNGRGTDESASEAVKWFKKAAAQGYADAQYELGNCYLEGTGVPKDPVAGVNLFKQAAEGGLPAAQNALGLCYQHGKGIARDYVQAYKWLSLAAAEDDANSSEIKVSLAKVESVLSQEQIAEGQRLAREFKPNEKNSGGNNAANDLPNNVAPASSTVTGSVNVTAEDPHAEVFVDGNLVGNAPAKLKLEPGKHTVEVRSPGKKSFHRDLTVGAGAELTVRADLQPE